MLNAAQTFYLDKGAVQNALESSITRIDLYFKKKPSETNNKSGIVGPGVQVRVVPTQDGVPNLDNLGVAPKCYVKWGNIKDTADASAPTIFRFNNPFPVSTGKDYGFVVDFDGDEDFELWTSVKGDYLIGTTQTSPGPSGKYDGSYFTKITAAPNTAIATNNALQQTATQSSTTGANTPGSSYTTASWRGVNDTDLKFTVFVARYTSSGSPWNSSSANGVIFTPSGGGIVSNNGLHEYRVPAVAMEYVTFDKNLSQIGTSKQGELVFQNTVYYSHGSNSTPTPVSVTSNSVLVTGPSGMDWTKLYNQIQSGTEWIVIYSENHAGPGADVCAVRKVLTVQANNVLQLSEPVGFTNTAARFFKSPVASLYATDTIQTFGAVKDIMVMTSSTANGTVRFVNNTILTLSATAGGNGYNNTDVLTIGGYESVAGAVGGHPAKANLVTNSVGGIVGLYMSNVGCGFVNTALATYTFANSTGGNSNGAGGAFKITTGAVIKSELLGTDGFGGEYANCTVINLSIGKMQPEFLLNNPAGTAYNAFQRFGYYETSAPQTYIGRAYYAFPDASVTERQIVNGAITTISGNNLPMMPSRSNEFAILYPNGQPCNATSNSINQLQVDVGSSNASVIIYRTASNNDFTAVAASTYSTKVLYTHFIYNNDYTNEHTNYGNSWAKQVTSKVTLVGDGLYAEDLLFYVDAWRPANTDIQVYARIYNSHDGDTFDQKDWTRLQMNAAVANLYSSPTDRTDLNEYSFGFQGAPNTGIAYAGVVSTTLNSSNIAGSGTTLNTLNVGDLIKVYQPLFPNNYMITVVNSVSNASFITVTDPVANAGIVGSGLKLEKIVYNHQAFNNKLNQNVVRYYTSSMGVMDGFDTMQFKVLFLSSNDAVYPIYDDIRAVAVTA